MTLVGGGACSMCICVRLHVNMPKIGAGVGKTGKPGRVNMQASALEQPCIKPSRSTNRGSDYMGSRFDVR